MFEEFYQGFLNVFAPVKDEMNTLFIILPVALVFLGIVLYRANHNFRI